MERKSDYEPRGVVHFNKLYNKLAEFQNADINMTPTTTKWESWFFISMILKCRHYYCCKINHVRILAKMVWFVTENACVLLMSTRPSATGLNWNLLSRSFTKHIYTIQYIFYLSNKLKIFIHKLGLTFNLTDFMYRYITVLYCHMTFISKNSEIILQKQIPSFKASLNNFFVCV